MKLFIDTEFLEGTQKKTFLGFNCGNTKPTIDLISIGIVAEDGREYYAVSKDFNFKEAWNRYDIKECYGAASCQNKDFQGNCTRSEKCDDIKVYWIREHVLKPIYLDWIHSYNGKIVRLGLPYPLMSKDFTYSNFKKALKTYGKSNAQIAEEVKEFVYNQDDSDRYNGTFKSKPEFYGYYADFDWVVFAWLFGKMIDLPNGFPMYCIDLKQMMDSIIREKISPQCYVTMDGLKKQFDAGKINNGDLSEVLKWVKALPNYPKQTNEHSAIHDARWNKKLYEFLTEI